MNPQPLEPFALTVRQRLVLEAVSARSQDIATLYEDALRSLQESRRTLRFYAPGHSVRLFMHDMPQIFDLPTLGSLPQLSAKIQALDPIWRAAHQSGCRGDGGWNGEIDSALGKLLTALEDFFSWREEQLPKKQQIAEEVLRRSDPGPAALPADLFERRGKRWLKLFGFFNSVAHSGSTSIGEFQERLTEVEDVVLSCLYREPSANFAAIDAILAEEEAGA